MMKVSRLRFEELVEEAFEELPKYFKNKLENITIVVEDFPVFRDLSDKYSILGLYRGIPYPNRGIYYGNVLPDVITLYQKPIERRVNNIEELKKLIRKVLYHEIGHYFGFSDDELYTIMNG